MKSCTVSRKTSIITTPTPRTTTLPSPIIEHGGNLSAIIILLMGPPGAGKTTLAKNLQTEWGKASLYYNVTRFTFDEFQGNWTSLREKHAQIYESVFKLLQDLTAPLPHLILLDDTFHLNSMRKPYWRLACTTTTMRVGFVMLNLIVPLPVAIESDAGRINKGYLGPALVTKIYEAFEPVTPEQMPFIISIEREQQQQPTINQIIHLANDFISFMELKRSRKAAKPSLHTEVVNVVGQVNTMLNQKVGHLIRNLARDEHFEHLKHQILLKKQQLFSQFQSNPSLDNVGFIISNLSIKALKYNM